MIDVKCYLIAVLICSYKIIMRLTFFSQLLAFQVSSVKYAFFYCDFVFPLWIYEEVLYFLDIILCQLCEL